MDIELDAGVLYILERLFAWVKVNFARARSHAHTHTHTHTHTQKHAAHAIHTHTHIDGTQHTFDK